MSYSASVQGIHLMNQISSAPGLHQVPVVIECYITDPVSEQAGAGELYRVARDQGDY